MTFAKRNNGTDEENRKQALGPREHAGMRAHGEAERGVTTTSERLADSPIPHMNQTSLLAHIGTLAVIAAAFTIVFATVEIEPTSPLSAPVDQESQVSATAGSGVRVATSSVTKRTEEESELSPTKAKAVEVESPKKPSDTAIIQEPPPSNQVRRIENPYSTPPFSFESINVTARTALVNILCLPSSGSLKPITASGVIIDPRGVILTNAHVAQYVLLSQVEQVTINCEIRTGSPAQSRWYAQVLFMPTPWVEKHAADIRRDRPVGTGEHDYALLRIVGGSDGSPLLASFPHLAPDTREAIGFTDDQVLVASYPAEFLGGLAAMRDLYPSTSITVIGQLMTLGFNSVDVLSLGGVISAQSGSSGGGVVNAWNRLIGIITTTSEGATTSERDLRAITLSYIDRDLAAQTGQTLAQYLEGDLEAKRLDFTRNTAPRLVSLLLKEIVR